MNNTIYSENILQKKLPSIYYLFFIFPILIMIIIFYLDFTSYYNGNFVVKKNDYSYDLCFYITKEDLKYILNNDPFIFNDKKYRYWNIRISEENYLDDKNNIVKLVYLESNLENIYLIDNYMISTKIKKEKKKIIYYLIDIFKRRI